MPNLEAVALLQPWRRRGALSGEVETSSQRLISAFADCGKWSAKVIRLGTFPGQIASIDDVPVHVLRGAVTDTAGVSRTGTDQAKTSERHSTVS